jgi:hypothetical protein
LAWAFLTPTSFKEHSCALAHVCIASVDGGASVLLGVYVILFLAWRPYEPLQLEYPVPALLLSVALAVAAVVLWRAGCAKSVLTLTSLDYLGRTVCCP